MSNPPARQHSEHRQDRTRPDPQRHIAALRANVLGGRGPDASQTELDAHQHQRVVIGGVPVTVAREQVDLNTALARSSVVNQARADAARRLAQLTAKPSSPTTQPASRVAEPAPPQRRYRGTGVAYAWVLGVLIGFALGSRRHRRGQQSPGAVQTTGVEPQSVDHLRAAR
ncbi:MAG: hypothetical protein L0H41_00410 [Microlunatus sp.]|nr:hypothetical protein [Microlunatus sp.]MDN5770733.1 hypothetical protein [Microlunatus sp.]MDN5804284.1 hypothetical protein [Microlunatus sp.]